MYNVGEGNYISFWHDPWSGHTPLKELFPLLFACSQSKEAWISNLIVSNSKGGSRSWNLQFPWASQDWELDTVCSFIEFLYSSMPRGEGVDNLTWKLTKTEVFDVCSYYKLLSGPLTDVFPWECIWCAKVPKKVPFFWKTTRDRILTIDNLVKRGQFLVNRCCLCCCDGESVNHLLLHYKFSHALWRAVFEVFGIQWVMLKIVSSLLFAWRNWYGKHLSIVWNLVLTCLMWSVWKECNTCIFEDDERPLDLLKALLFSTLFQWACVWGFTNCISISEFLNSFSLCFWSSCILFFLHQNVHHR